jgi:radical SAM superfamily enzyme YgiQ (UPF0313 family)
MRLYLINPRNPTISLVHVAENRFNKYRIWKPLGLLILARLTPAEWEITVIDENLALADYDSMPRPDLVGITAFTSQAERAYEIAAQFRSRGVPVVMGGIHATMRTDEALERVDVVVTGEAEDVWPQVLEDARSGVLKRLYGGTTVDMERIPPARHDLLSTGYAFGSIQTTRGCPLNCSFCSVTAFNGKRFRRRPIQDVIEEFKLIREKLVLIVDDNLVGTSRQHVAYAKELFRAMIDAKIRKKWVGQVTVNMGEDEELIRLAAKSGCIGVLIGFESPSEDGLIEINKKFNIRKGHDPRSSVRRLQRHGIVVLGSFIFGLDVDKKGVGQQMAGAATSYGVDIFELMFVTPLPGTRLWETMECEGRIVAHSFPEDWKYYTLNLPVANYMNLSWADMIEEFTSSFRTFYSYRRILQRFFGSLVRMRKPFNSLVGLVANIIFRRNLELDIEVFRTLDLSKGPPYAGKAPSTSPTRQLTMTA